jgi:hypothetical protein
MDPNRGAWSFEMADGTVWGRGDGATMFVMPESTIPQDPSLPGLSTVASALTYLVFGSADGAARTAGAVLEEGYCLTRPTPPSTVKALPTNSSRLASTTGQRRSSHAPPFWSSCSARAPATNRTTTIANNGATNATL